MPHPNNTLSVIVPTLNEATSLPKNLDSLCRSPEVVEILVVDGGSQDGTQALVQQSDDPRVRLLSCAPGRGRQMNLGAHHARGEWLLFHHADSILAPAAVGKITRLPDDASWGGYRHRFVPSNWKLRFISALHNWRCARTGVIYGDQSMFVRRSFFRAVGGFADQGLEDLQFSDAALRFESPVLLRDEVCTDARKFIQIGEFRALAQVASILWRYERQRRVGNERFFKPYR